MKKALIIGVMGGGRANAQDFQMAYRLGQLVASKGWVLLNGGRDAGIMAASAKGAAEHGGITVGILPDSDAGQASEFIQIPVCTGMGSARNAINVLSSDVVVACRGGAGTLSEIALALKHGKPVILLSFDDAMPLLEQMGYKNSVLLAETPEKVIGRIEAHLAKGLLQ